MSKNLPRLNLKPVIKFLPCPHRHVLGDNYGMTCSDCGEAVEGYGYGGWFGSRLTGEEICIHHYVDGICMYCQGVENAG